MWLTVYDNQHFLFTDSAAILNDEQEKKPCRKFLQKGIRMTCNSLLTNTSNSKVALFSATYTNSRLQHHGQQ